MAAVVLDDEVVVVAHDDERLANDEGQPDNHVAPPRSKLALDKPDDRGIYFPFCLEGKIRKDKHRNKCLIIFLFIQLNVQNFPQNLLKYGPYVTLSERRLEMIFLLSSKYISLP